MVLIVGRQMSLNFVTVIFFICPKLKISLLFFILYKTTN